MDYYYIALPTLLILLVLKRGWLDFLHCTWSFPAGKSIENYMSDFPASHVFYQRVVINTSVWLWICSFYWLLKLLGSKLWLIVTILPWLVVWNMCFPIILGISSSQLTFLIFFRGVDWNHQPGDGTNITMENHRFQWVNPLFLWQFSIAMLVYQRLYGYKSC